MVIVMSRFSAKVPSFARSATARGVAVAAGLWLFAATVPLTGCISRSLTQLTIEPAYGDTCIYQGGQAQYEAYGTYTESGHASTTENLTDQVQWSVTFPAMATISSSGLLTAGYVATGTSDIVASTEGGFGVLRATSNVEVPCPSTTSSVVDPKSPTSLHIVPASATLISAGDTEQPLAIGILAAGHGTVDLSQKATWSSSDPAVATVNSSGVIRAVGPGTATITARETTSDGRVLTGAQTVTFQGAQNQ
jgi:trimeric autotransporter adhesin